MFPSRRSRRWSCRAFRKNIRGGPKPPHALARRRRGRPQVGQYRGVRLSRTPVSLFDFPTTRVGRGRTQIEPTSEVPDPLAQGPFLKCIGEDLPSDLGNGLPLRSRALLQSFAQLSVGGNRQRCAHRQSVPYLRPPSPAEAGDAPTASTRFRSWLRTGASLPSPRSTTPPPGPPGYSLRGGAPNPEPGPKSSIFFISRRSS